MDETTIRDESLKKNIVLRLKKIEGQIKGINKMMDNDAYCNDILIQVSAVQSALNSVSKIILENHIRGCVVDKIKEDDDDVIDELIKAIGRLL